MELVRQPVFLLLMTGSVLFEIFLAVPYYFAFGDEPKLVENSVLAAMLFENAFHRFNGFIVVSFRVTVRAFYSERARCQHRF